MHPKPMTPTSGPLRPSVVVRTVVRFLLDNTTPLSERGRSFSVEIVGLYSSLPAAAIATSSAR